MRRRKKEESIESLLFDHPYLLDAQFSFEHRHERQYHYAEGRVDYLLKKNGQFHLVEVKREPLNFAHVQQLTKYILDLAEVMPLAQEHFLVGLVPRSELQNSFPGTFAYKISVRLIGREIPSRVKLNPASGRYVAARPYEPGLNLLYD